MYDKHETKITGFVDIGDVGNQLSQIASSYMSESATPRPSIATHMLVLMVRGIFFHMEYPYAHFPTHRLTASSLFSIMWEGIERLEEVGFKVIAITTSPSRYMTQPSGIPILSPVLFMHVGDPNAKNI